MQYVIPPRCQFQYPSSESRYSSKFVSSGDWLCCTGSFFDTDRLNDAELKAIARGGFEEWARLKEAQSADPEWLNRAAQQQN